MSLFQKMVIALPPEFFEGWQWKAGDEVLHKHDYLGEWENEYILDNGIARVISKNDGNVFGLYIPLPSQKQLQSMLDLSPIDFINDLNEYAQEPMFPGMGNEQFKTDMECFTLAYVMDRKFKMNWDGEKWVRNGR